MPQYESDDKNKSHSYFLLFKPFILKKSKPKLNTLETWTYCHKGFLNRRNLRNMITEFNPTFFIWESPKNKI